MKKVVTSLFALVVAFSVIIPGASAAPKPDEPQRAVVVEMDKPIADVQYVSNYKLGQMIDAYNSGSTILNIVNTILYAGGVTAPAGAVNSLTSLLTGDMSALESAYYSGKHAYFVTVYASGVEPSLSKISYRYYTNSYMSFRD